MREDRAKLFSAIGSCGVGSGGARARASVLSRLGRELQDIPTDSDRDARSSQPHQSSTPSVAPASTTHTLAASTIARQPISRSAATDTPDPIRNSAT